MRMNFAAVEGAAAASAQTPRTPHCSCEHPSSLASLAMACAAIYAGAGTLCQLFCTVLRRAVRSNRGPRFSAANERCRDAASPQCKAVVSFCTASQKRATQQIGKQARRSTQLWIWRGSLLMRSSFSLTNDSASMLQAPLSAISA